jgi:T5SS/PEP-CTERM-associated repeat protein
MTIGWGGGSGRYLMTGGAFSTDKAVYVGGITTNALGYAIPAFGAPSDGTLEVGGGTFAVSNALYLGEAGTGALTVVGGGVLRANHLVMTNGVGPLRLVAGPAGFGALTVVGNFLIGAQSRLEVDVSAYDRRNGAVIELLRYGAMPTAFPNARVTVTGWPGRVEQDAASGKLLLRLGSESTFILM